LVPILFLNGGSEFRLKQFGGAELTRQSARPARRLAFTQRRIRSAAFIWFRFYFYTAEVNSA
jgi:hypothetical protein